MTLLTLLFGAVGSGVLLLRNSPDEAWTGHGPRLSIGYYMNNASLVTTGDDGGVLFRATAISASQSFDDDTINLREVHVTYAPRTNVPWTIRANTGAIPPDGNIIRLSGNVVAQTTNDGNAAVTIITDYLELDTETYIADTQQDVAIDYTGNRVFATGMRAFFKEDRLQLISNVNGKFIP